MRILRCILALLLVAHVPLVCGWNAVAHRIIAQIAYDNMTPEARDRFSQYNHALDVVYEPQSFINSAVWLDTIRADGIAWYDYAHFIDLYFSDEHLPLPQTPRWNAVWAIGKAINTLQNKDTTVFDKGLSFRILAHVVGDIHQPMHTVSRVTKAYPEGDRGGQLFALGPNKVGDNLHSYWDMGGGAFASRARTVSQIRKRAAKIARPCADIDPSPYHWVKESHRIATNFAYKIKEGETPSKKYENETQKVSEQQIALAGCRLAYLLNGIDQQLSESIRKHSTKRRL